MILGIDHIQLAAPVGCEERTRWFFGEVLGLAELPKPPKLAQRGGCWFACGDQQLHIGVEKDFSPAKKAHPAFRVVNVSAVRERLLAHGISSLEDKANPEVRRIFADDPWGNRLEFVEKS